MDVVYVTKHSDNNEELRHSLRSLRNLEHDRVWLSGYRPKWANTEEIRTRPQPAAQKHLSTSLNILAACHHPDVSDPFILFNDDFFVMHSISEVPTYHHGPLADWIIQSPKTTYIRRAMTVLHVLREMGFQNPLSYELHMPLVVRKQEMIQACEIAMKVSGGPKRSIYGNLAKRSIYGNLTGIGGEEVADCKISDINDLPDEDWLFVSTTDGSFACGKVGEYLRDRFSEPGAYEL